MWTQVVGQLEDSGGYPFETIISRQSLCKRISLVFPFWDLSIEMITRFVLSFFFSFFTSPLLSIPHTFVEISLIHEFK